MRPLVTALVLCVCLPAVADDKDTTPGKPPRITRPDGTLVHFYRPEFVSIDSLHDGLQAVGVPRVRVLRLEEQGLLALDGEPDLVKRALELIAMLDRVPPQVAVEAEVLLVSKGKAKGLVVDDLKEGENREGAKPPNVIVLGEGGRVSQVLRELKVDGSAKAVARVSLLATQGIESKVEQTSQRSAVVVSEVRDGDAVHRTTSFRAGVSLKVTPIHVGTRHVTLRIAPTVNAMWGAVPLLSPTHHPTQTTHSATTTVTIEFGKSVAIVGLMKRSEADQQAEPQVVVDQPLRGNAGPRAQSREQEAEFVVTITPRIVSPSGASAQK